jgi:hypothetical protein
LVALIVRPELNGDHTLDKLGIDGLHKTAVAGSDDARIHFFGVPYEAPCSFPSAGSRRRADSWGLSAIGRHWFDRGRRRSDGPCLPEGYRLDQSDPDILVLRRPDDSDVAFFSARG